MTKTQIIRVEVDNNTVPLFSKFVETSSAPFRDKFKNYSIQSYSKENNQTQFVILADGKPEDVDFWFEHYGKAIRLLVNQPVHKKVINTFKKGLR